MAAGRSVRTILAAVADAEAGGQLAARKAIELAWLFDADVVLYHACYEPALGGGVLFDSPRLAAARRDAVARATQRLEVLAASFAETEVAVRVRVEWQRGIPEAIARAATKEGAELVAAEPRYRATTRRRGLSRIDWEVARLCPVPLLLARSAAPYSKPRIVAAVDPGGHGLRVSTLDAGIVSVAAALASVTAGSVRVIHCLRDPPLSLSLRPSQVLREQQRVKEMVRKLARGAGLSARDARFVGGEPAEALLDAVSAERADVLVMGTVVRGALGQLLIGSTTEQLMHVAPCDLLLVRPGSARLPARERGRG
jgi:universal stress protein E